MSKKSMTDAVTGMECPGCEQLFSLKVKAEKSEQNISLFRMEMDKILKGQEGVNDRLLSALDELRQQWTDDMKGVAQQLSMLMQKIGKSELRIIMFMLTTAISAIIAILTRLIK